MALTTIVQLSVATALFGLGMAAARFLMGIDPEYAHIEPRESSPPYPDGAEENVFWFIQISDIHVSRYYGLNRSRDLKTFCGAHLPFIDPSLVLVTGDLTDAKSKDFYSSQQYTDEWKTYQSAIQSSGALVQYPFLEVRGNHDGFDTPMKKGFDSIYKSFSIHNARMASVHSAVYFHNTSFGSYAFVALDAVPRPGPRRPFNFFGILNEERLVDLKRAARVASRTNHTVFYGHYPSSFIHQPYTGALRNVLSGATAYLSGHLHDLAGLGKQLYAQQRSGQLELELGDWKENRRFRLLSFDHDLFSFADFTFNQFPIVLITNPKSARFQVRTKEPLGRMAHSTHIRMLVFSPRIITSVQVFVDDRALGNAKPASPGSHLYVIPWSASDYREGLHTVKVVVSDTRHRMTVGHVFSLDDSRVQLDWFPTLIFRLDMAFLFKLMFITIWTAVLAVLAVARWRPRLLTPSTSGWWAWFPATQRGLCLFARDTRLVAPFSACHVYVAIGPCAVAELLGDHYGVIFVHGVWVEGYYLPGSLTFLYGFFQVLFFHSLLLLHFAWTLDYKRERSKADETPPTRRACCGPWWAYGPVLTALLFQANTCRSLYKAYGPIVLILGPGHTWMLLLGLSGVLFLSACRS